MDLERLLEIQRTTFGGDKEEWDRYRRWVGDENHRFASDAGGLTLIPMGQYFGGKSVPMTGIAAVAVSPEARGGGVATRLMCDTVRELHDKGVALSTLYPATEPLYRRAGYEQAGVQIHVRLALFSIGLKHRELPCKRMEDGDMPLVRAIHAEYARRNPGNLDRHAFRWNVMRHKTEGFVFGEEAYIIYRTGPLRGEQRNVILVYDHAATTPAGVRRILTFLADHGSIYRDAIIKVGPSDPVLAIVPEQRYTAHMMDHWMLRITHLPAAIAGRGYNPGVTAELHLRVADDVIDGHEGDWVVRVADGAAVAERGGRGEIALDIRALASLYSGHLSVATLQTAGWIEGPDDALAAAQTVFSGAAPWMPDGF